MEKKEKRLVWSVSVLLMVITTLPYIYGYFITPSDRVYTGASSMSIIDTDVYYSYINQAKEGRFLFESLATTLPEPRVIFSPFWLVTGWVARLGVSEILATQLVRILLIPVCVWGCYFLFSELFSRVRQRVTALILLCFTSGFGFFFAWVLSDAMLTSTSRDLYYWPPDLWVPEAFFFLSAFRSGHFLLGTLLLCCVFFFVMKAQQQKQLRYAVYAGLCALGLLSFHPYHAPTIAVVCLTYFSYLFIKEKRLDYRFLGYMSVLGAFCVPPIAYYLWLTQASWVKAFHATANVTLTTAPELTLLSYGFPLILALVALFFVFKNKTRFGMNPVYFDFVVCWFFGQFVCMYLPFLFQRRLMQGWQFPVVVLGTLGLFYLYDGVKKRFPSFSLKMWIPTAVIVFFLLFASSNALTVLRDIGVSTNSFVLSMRYDTAQALTWVKNNTPVEASFLVSYLDLQYVPAFALRKVYQFHPHETPLSKSKEDDLDWFFLTNTSDEHKQAFLKENNIQYVWYNTELVMATKNYMGTQNNLWFFEDIFKPEEKSYLKEVYRASDSLRIYQVIP